MSFSHKKLVASLSWLFSSICRKAFSISAVKAIMWVLNFNRIPVRSCIRFGPVYRQSFRLNASDDTGRCVTNYLHLGCRAVCFKNRKVGNVMQNAFVKIEVPHFLYETEINLFKELVVVFLNKSWVILVEAV